MKLLFKIILWLLVFFFSTSFLAVLAYRWLPVKVTPLMYIRSLEHDNDPVFADWAHEWVPLDSISPYMSIAVMASEDQRFLEHGGFDFQAIEEARREHEEGGRRRGASTISQQTAKNVFLWPRSSWVRKGFEAYFTLLIEWIWPKERIMEVYLNSIEMGPGIYGVEAVAEEHFGCKAAELSKANCALIAATLPNPLKFSSKYPTRYMRRRQQQIMVQMKYVKAMVDKKKREEQEKEDREKAAGTANDDRRKHRH